MTPLEEISNILASGNRVIVISEKEVDLKTMQGINSLFLLKMAEGSGAAGGRGGGFGERRVTKVLQFRYRDGVCEKLFETTDESKVALFEIPFYVARTPLTLADGSESMGYGVIDSELVSQFVEKAK